MADDTEKELKDMCQLFADELTRGPTMEWCKEKDFDLGAFEAPDDAEDATDEDRDDLDNWENKPSGYDWIQDAGYDTRFLIDSTGECIGGSVMVAGGGPTVWVDFYAMTVIGTWWSEPVRISFTDGWHAADALSEIYEMVKN